MYRYRRTYRGPRTVSPELVVTEFERLRLDGALTAQCVCDAARPESAVLHPEFKWDDAVAADEYRLVQARQLIRAIVVISGDDHSEAQSVYVHVADEDETEPMGKYVPLITVAEDEAQFARALAEAQRYLSAAEHRFAELRKMAEIRGGKVEVLVIITQGFAAVRGAMELLKAG